MRIGPGRPARARATDPALARARGGGEAALLAVALATAAALVIRWLGLHQSLYGDELLTPYATADGVGGVLGRLGRFEQNPPLYFWLAALGRDLGGLDWMRLPSLLAGVAAVPLTYALGRLTIGRWPGVFAAAMVACGPFLAFYGTEARPYALMTALLLASAVCLLVAIERGGALWWAGMIAAAALALYTQYVSVFWLAAQGGWALWAARDRRRPLVVSYALVVVAFLPWLPTFLDQRELLTLSVSITARSAAKTAAQIAVGHPFVPLREALGGAGQVAVVVFAVALIAGAVIALMRARRAPRPWSDGAFTTRATLLLVLLIVVTPVGLWAYAHLGGQSFGLGRYWIASAPPALLIAGGLLAELPRPAALAAAAIAVVLTGSIALRTMDGALQRPATKSAAHFADRNAPPRAPVVEAPILAIARAGTWLIPPEQASYMVRIAASPTFGSTPMGQGYSIYYRRPHLRYGIAGYRPSAAPVVPLAQPAAWRRAAAAGRVVTLSPVIHGSFAPPSPPARLHARLVRRQLWRGFIDIVASEYVLPRTGRARG